MSNHLIKILKNDPLSINSYLVNLTTEELSKEYFLNNTLLHLVAIYYPRHIPEILCSPILDTDYNYNLLLKYQNFFGYTWFHIICQYHMNHFHYFKIYIDKELAKIKDITGNTCLHILARFNPEYLAEFINNSFVDEYLLSIRDILGNTFLHILNYNHPSEYDKIKTLFSDKLLNVKNIFGKECFNYYRKMS